MHSRMLSAALFTLASSHHLALILPQNSPPPASTSDQQAPSYRHSTLSSLQVQDPGTRPATCSYFSRVSSH
ncbi:hypothetical protein C8R43DRAFT_117847 [Mycena crocata]|nr:hypothetical protein C8R43DRAFT_117847 [Mycena crocata]